MRTTSLLLLVLCCASLGFSQESSAALHQGAWEFGVFAAGGHSVSGGTGDTGVFNAGVRLGKILTGEHLGGPLRGNLEYAVDVYPVYLVHTGDTRYAAGFDPLILKWNFTGARRVAPYLDFGGGMLFSRSDIPPGTNKVNFVPQASFGLQLFSAHKRAVVVAVKYAHISNAGLADFNPGINTVQFSVGYHWFH